MMVQSDAGDRSDIDPVWADFLRNKVNSFVKWDLVRFFHDNPHTTDTADNIARYTGRDVRTITHELRGLVDVGVLEMKTISGVQVFKMAADESMRDLIDDFVAACHDREFRIKAIHHVIHGMGFQSDG